MHTPRVKPRGRVVTHSSKHAVAKPHEPSVSRDATSRGVHFSFISVPARRGPLISVFETLLKLNMHPFKAVMNPFRIKTEGEGGSQTIERDTEIESKRERERERAREARRREEGAGVRGSLRRTPGN